MKTIVKFLIPVLLLAGAFQASAQKQKDGPAWMEKMRSERIAFLTAEVGISPAEAEKFWPLYNEAEQKRNEAFEASMEAFKDLEDAVKAGKGEKEISSLLQKYLSAVKAAGEVDDAYVAKYRKVLPVEKIAKLYLAEEKFRRQSIHRLHGGPKKPDNQ